MSTMTVTFPGGKRVDAHFAGFTLRTDQPAPAGGDGTAPSPFDLFLASIASCAGFYAKSYCDTRGIACDGLGLEMRIVRDEGAKLVSRLELEIRLPQGFPERHREGIVRAAGLCAVKKHLEHPPEIEIRTASAAPAPALAG